MRPRTSVGRVRTYLFQGLKRFHMRRFMSGVHMILARFGLPVFLRHQRLSPHAFTRGSAWYSWYCVIVAGMVYMALHHFPPHLSATVPYHTALTTPLRFCRTLLCCSGHVIWQRFRRGRGNETDFVMAPIRQTQTSCQRGECKSG